MVETAPDDPPPELPDEAAAAAPEAAELAPEAALVAIDEAPLAMDEAPLIIDEAPLEADDMAPPVELAIEPPLEVAVPARASAPSASFESDGLLKT